MRHLLTTTLFALAASAFAPAQAAANPVGTGCAGSNGVPTLTANQPPYLGEPITLDVANLPLNPSWTLWMWSTNDVSFAGQPLPLDLAFAGMPGCLLYQDAFVNVYQDQVIPGSISQTINIPLDLTLVGCRVLTQTLHCDFGVNATGYTTANMLELLLDVRP